MYAHNFNYDGLFLSDFRFMICSFGSANGESVRSSGSDITFDMVQKNNGREYFLSGTTYNDRITADFDICKNPAFYSQEKMYISQAEFRSVAKWLNREQMHDVYFIGDDSDEVHYNASFNLEKIIVSDRIVGIRLHMETDSPFGYGEEINNDYECAGINDSKTISVESDKIGYIYPVVTVHCLSQGNLTIKNITEDKSTVINNCSAGETITIDNNNKLILSSLASHKIFDDFNYQFFYLNNSIDDNKTVFTASINCDITVSYRPIIKYAP